MGDVQYCKTFRVLSCIHMSLDAIAQAEAIVTFDALYCLGFTSLYITKPKNQKVASNATK